MAVDTSEDEYIDSDDDLLSEEPDAVKVESSERQSRPRKPRSRQSSRGKSRSRQSTSTGQASRSSRERSQSAQSAQSTEKVEVAWTTEYRDLLNDMIADASGHSAAFDPALRPSRIGWSTWSAHEKSTLFEALERHGVGNLPRLTRAVGTKSQYEIQVYIQSLQQDLATQHESAPQKLVHWSDVSAASEITAECEAALNTAADALSSRVEKQEQLAEHSKLGDDWLIDERVAEEDEQSYEQAVASTAEVKVEVKAEGSQDVSTTDTQSAMSDPTHLLRPAAFLQLSQTLFMNNGENQELNWHHVDRITDATDEPALFRRAWDDLHALTVSLTRRLVQASIFQAMTRLRAHNSARADWSPVAAVRGVDVRSALEMLHMGPDWNEYWAKVARRCRVSVYSDSKKYNDGRPGTKNGFLLDYDEVEAALGIDDHVAADQNNDEWEEGDSSDLMAAGSDAYTNVEEATSDEDDDDNDDNDGGSTTDVSRGPPVEGFRSTRQRKRRLSPTSFARVEDEHVNALDSRMSAREEVRLWQEILQVRPPPQSVVDATGSLAAPTALPPAPSDMHSTPHDHVPLEWRSAVTYQGPWEHGRGVPALEDFQRMTARGHAGRKRRRLIQDRIAGVASFVKDCPPVPPLDDDDNDDDDDDENVVDDEDAMEDVE